MQNAIVTGHQLDGILTLVTVEDLLAQAISVILGL